jgi:toxin ParE1/3/4
MNQFQVSDAARGDLDEIWFYIAGDNPGHADKLIRSVTSRFPTLASIPEIGRLREELAPRLRSFAVGNYVIFYRVIENGVEIVRVLHGARDLQPIFENYDN